jgi:hypothetical protein
MQMLRPYGYFPVQSQRTTNHYFWKGVIDMEITVDNLEDLRKKVAQIEHDLIEVKKNLNQITFAVSPKTEVDLCSIFPCVDKEKLKEWLDEWFKQMGIDIQPIGAEQLQEMMLKEGIRPEDNIASRGIIEMREE